MLKNGFTPEVHVPLLHGGMMGNDVIADVHSPTSQVQAAELVLPIVGNYKI